MEPNRVGWLQTVGRDVDDAGDVLRLKEPRAEGLLKRVSCEHDARGTNAVLTYRGLKRLQAAWPTHLASVRRHLVDHLGELDLPRLAQALQQVGTRAGGSRA